jgi:hypothetical protein
MTTWYSADSYQDGPRITVSDILKDPAIVPRRIIDVGSNKFIADQLLRGGPQAASGVVKFYVSNPLFATSPTAEVAEYGEFPVFETETGELMVATTIKRGGRLELSDELRRRNNIDLVNLKIQQVTNTFTRDWDAYFMALILAAIAVTSQVVPASKTWDDPLAATRKDIGDAMRLITSAVLDSDHKDNYLGYEPDTLVLNVNDVTDMVGNDDAWKAWLGGNVADQSPAVTGQLPNRLYGLDVWSTWNVPVGSALVLQRNVTGFISEEQPFQASGMEFKPENDSWRTVFKRQATGGCDQPKSAALITGITT